MRSIATIDVAPGDVVAVRLPPGEVWRDIVAAVWAANAVLFPIDHRLPPEQAAELLTRGRPTVVVDDHGWSRVPGGVRGDTGLGVLIATSGSTSHARLVELTRAALTAAVEASAHALGAEPADGWVSALPPAHIGGLLVVLRSVVLGAPLSFATPGDPSTLVPPPGAGFTSLVPTTVRRALDAGVDLSGYRAVLVGGSAFPPDLADRAATAGVRCVPTYGLTESCGGVIYAGVPLRGVAVRIGEAGEVELAGPTLMRGQVGGAGAGGAFTRDGWLRTGDAGAIDTDGRLRVTGRLDDVIITGGEKVWPADVEAVLREHPQVADVAVTGAPDPTWGARVVAVVVPRDPLAPPTLGELRDQVGARLGRYQAPLALVLVDTLPRTPLGKIAPAELRRLALDEGDGDG